MKNSYEDKPIDSLNMIPFIDIMLVLLTIVLTTSSFIAAGRIPVQLPEATSAEKEVNQTETLEIDAEGVIYHAGVAISVAELRGKLGKLDKDTAFLLRADKKVALQHFVDVVDILNELHFSRVAVQTEIRAGTPLAETP